MVEYDDIDNSKEGYLPPFGVDFLGMAERIGYTFPKARSHNDWTLNQDSRRKHMEMEVNEKEGGQVDFLNWALRIGYTFPELRRCNDSDTSSLDNDDTRPTSSSPPFSIGLSQDEILNNVALLSPSATVDHNIVAQRIFLDITSNEAKDEHVDKKEDQEGEVIPKDNDRAYENVHEEAYEQSEKTISNADCLPYQVVTRRCSSTLPVHEPRSASIIRDVDQARLVHDYIYEDFKPESIFDKEVVFTYKHLIVTRHLFQSLKPRGHVASVIVDCWSAYLNHQEMAKSDPSTLRFYMSTLVVAVLAFNMGKPNKEQGYTSFKNIMNEELKLFSRVSLKSIDMFFFPVALSGHYYLIVFDLKTPASFYIIDNLVAKGPVKNQHGDTPKHVAKAFVKFLKENDITTYSGDDVVSPTPIVVNMPWRTSKNVDDCGVFTMRHMETFMGDLSWNCGLKKDKRGTLDNLRHEYVSTLILFKENELSSKILCRAEECFKLIQRLEEKTSIDDSNEEDPFVTFFTSL